MFWVVEDFVDFDLVGMFFECVCCFIGIEVVKMCVLIGVIGIIYELCLNVIVDVVVLCVKVGNVCILCGGFEVFVFNCVIVGCVCVGLCVVCLFEDVV